MGVVVRGSTRVAIEEVTVEGARRWGILAQDSEVKVTGCRVGGLLSPYARGVEVINSEQQPPSTIAGCRVAGPVYEGIVSRFSRVRMIDNEVEESTLRGVAINEMSLGRMEGNEVTNALGVAYACGDMSRCEIVDNRARGIGAASQGGRSAQGNGAAVQYHSEAFVHGLSTSDVEGQPVVALTGSTLAPGPLSSTGVGAGIWGVVMVLLATTFVPLILSRISGVSWPPLMLTMALLVQLIHQIEHTIQMAQAHLLRSWQAHGLAGALFDQEWVHLGFNAVLLVALVVALVGYGRERLATWRRRAPRAYLALAGATAIQGYHVIEHLVKIAQHVNTGAAPAAGVLGRAVDLVWLHFGINLVVTTGLAVAYLGLRITDDLVRGPGSDPSSRLHRARASPVLVHPDLTPRPAAAAARRGAPPAPERRWWPRR